MFMEPIAATFAKTHSSSVASRWQLVLGRSTRDRNPVSHVRRLEGLPVLDCLRQSLNGSEVLLCN